jgi:parvulin-like peptidyl-prolyl isomerase
MLRSVLLLLLLASAALAQENSPPAAPKLSSSTASSAPKTAQTSGPAVITISGVCSSGATTKAVAAKSLTCKTIVSRAEFERLMDILQVPPTAKKQFATQYATALIMAYQARKRGLDHGEKYEELLKLTRLQVLGRELAQNIQTESSKVSDQEIQDYYRNNAAAYGQATLERLYVPRIQQQEPPKGTPDPAEAKKRQEESESAMKKEADDLRARAASGEDFTKLQTEAYKFANFKAAPPPVKMDKTRSTSLPPTQASVFDMKPGEVSQVFADPSGYFVYKLVQKETVPLDAVREEIRATLAKQRMQDTMHTMEQSITPKFDEAYFGPSPAPGSMPAMHPPSGAPSSGPK